MSASTTLEHVAGRASTGLESRGIRDYKISVGRSRSVAVTYRKGRAEKVQESVRRGLVVHLYEDGRYAVCDSNDLSTEALEGFLDDAVALTRAMGPDPHREITDPALYSGRPDLDLEIYDGGASSLDPATRRDLAGRAEAAALQASGKDGVSAEATFEDETSDSYRLHSNGFEGRARESSQWLFAEVSLRDGDDRRPSGWDISGARRMEDLGSPEDVGAGAADQARARVGAKVGPTETAAMVVDRRAAGRLLGYLIGATFARAIQQKTSFLDGKVGQRVGSGVLDITDDPLLVGGFASRLYDGEGISARTMPLFVGGVLQNLYVDTYYGKKLALEPTTGSRSNLVFTPGGSSLGDLVSGIGRGVYVRGFVGGNSNPTTGDFSLGVFGNLVEGGRLGAPVSGMNISGNHLELWKRLVAAGDDPWLMSSARVPSLVFEDVQFSGE